MTQPNLVISKLHQARATALSARWRLWLEASMVAGSGPLEPGLDHSRTGNFDTSGQSHALRQKRLEYTGDAGWSGPLRPPHAWSIISGTRRASSPAKHPTGASRSFCRPASLFAASGSRTKKPPYGH